jgi:glycine/D-amino acid oxidase-like deaminating enzyme
MGPCGLFAGLILAEMGFNPIILERGKIVRERTVDTFKFWRKAILDPSSNAQFGEGGAGTFSDGKLYSQIKDPRHLGRKVLTEFVEAGAPEEILFVSKPHIGTFRLVSMIEHMREKIERLGGEIRFKQQVTDVLMHDRNGEKQIAGVVLASGETIETDHVVMALGHSARDTFEMLHARGVFFEPKPFSIGVRIEHPQSIIDCARFGAKNAGHPILGAADYKLAHHAANGRSVYSFCMCPGGTVVAAASEQGRLVTNGMSQYSRKERNANAGIVVGVTPEDFPGDFRTNPLAGIAFQRHWEEQAFIAGGSNWLAPLSSSATSSPIAPHSARRRRPVLQARRHADRPQSLPARIRNDGDARSARSLRPPDRRLLNERCGDDRRRNAHIKPHPHDARPGPAVAECEGALSRWRRRRLCRRHPLRRRGRHQDRGSRGAVRHGPHCSLGLLVLFAVTQHDDRSHHRANSRADRERAERMLLHFARHEFRSLLAAAHGLIGHIASNLTRVRCAVAEYPARLFRKIRHLFRHPSSQLAGRSIVFRIARSGHWEIPPVIRSRMPGRWKGSATLLTQAVGHDTLPPWFLPSSNSTVSCKSIRPRWKSSVAP